MVVTNHADVPVRLAADGRLLSLEIQPQDEPAVDPRAKKRKAPRPVVCKLPPELRPEGVSDERALILRPGSRYEEVINPALYCFDGAGAKAFVPGATVIAHLGFAPSTSRAAKDKTPRAPFVVEPTVPSSTTSGAKEIVAAPFVLPAASPLPPLAGGPSRDPNDPNAPRLELLAPARIDTPNEITVPMTFGVHNAGGRPVPLHIRRDNLVIDLDGPSGSAHCGTPTLGRAVPRDLFSTLGAGETKSFDVWVGEMCPDVVFDRPGLYRLRASLAFPNMTDGSPLKAWSQTVTAKDLVLVRVREGRLPFYTSPPQALGDAAR
jgi:hypothetical protein